MKTLISSAALLSLVACTTTISPEPHACDRIAERPGLRAEMEELRDLDRELARMDFRPITPRLRQYAKDASEACAYNQKLGAAPFTPDLRPWYRRAWDWLRGRPTP